MALTESVISFTHGQTVDSFLARLPLLPTGVIREIEQCVRDPGRREELLDILFEWTYPGLYKVRKVAGGVDFLCEMIGLLVKRNEQSPDSPATVFIVVLWALLIASPWILFSFLVWVIIGPVVWQRKNYLKRRVEKTMKGLDSSKEVLGKPRV